MFARAHLELPEPKPLATVIATAMSTSLPSPALGTASVFRELTTTGATVRPTSHYHVPDIVIGVATTDHQHQQRHRRQSITSDLASPLLPSPSPSDDGGQHCLVIPAPMVLSPHYYVTTTSTTTTPPRTSRYTSSRRSHSHCGSLGTYAIGTAMLTGSPTKSLYNEVSRQGHTP